ncbi:GYD domain-containing protein [Roseovarius sp. CAU 1744]|uniref:GYD domain-containing protein n=1 Tax=Roseovarius sp. CAU 1744 TaxID=3140368 RepID=UPI00325AC989
MPFYLFQGRYTTASLKAMVDDPQDREAAAKKLIEAVGGTLHHLFFCFGDEDVVALIEAPDDGAMAACALAVGASGSMSGGATTKLLTSAEAMKAMGAAKKAAASYTPASSG